MKRIYNRGFTLVELVVVLGVIGILSGALIFIINPVAQIQKGRDTTRKADLNNIRTAFEIYRQQEGRYPTQGEIPACGNEFDDPDGNITYMREFPCDPQGNPYTYSVDSQGVVYTLSACLENENDPDIAGPEEQVSPCTTTFVQHNP